jgi:hypothetical protein
MCDLAYVLVPRQFDSLQSELDRTLAAFKRGGEGDFPREKLALTTQRTGCFACINPDFATIPTTA